LIRPTVATTPRYDPKLASAATTAATASLRSRPQNARDSAACRIVDDEAMAHSETRAEEPLLRRFVHDASFAFVSVVRANTRRKARTPASKTSSLESEGSASAARGGPTGSAAPDAEATSARSKREHPRRAA
jgi:hypothetical protein